MKRTDVLRIAETGSYWGEVAIAWTSRGVAGLGWAKDAEEVAREASERIGAAEIQRRTAEEFAEEAKAFPGLLEALESGESFCGAYDIPGATSFFDRVWRACRSIPKGEVRTYAWLAEQAGSPRGARAAGQAMATNPVPLLTPCHRVLPSTMRVGNYGLGGPSVKSRLLRLEGAL